ncbi:MAG: beta-N-acetylhexosaminidase, partial [Chitinophagaceae bacterium]
VLKVLDLMSLYKLNVFHFHLTDDEGWRLEIPGLPELTTVGVRKGHATNDENFLHPSFGSGPENAMAGSGFYSREDFIDILKYAKQHYIEVIPEIEAPGHARAAVAAMTSRYNRLMKEGKPKEAEEFLLYHPRDTSVYKSVQRWYRNVMDPALPSTYAFLDTSVYKSVQRWYRNVMDPALPSTYAFLEKVTTELQAMYKEAGATMNTVHFGGDEVPTGVWKGSPAVQELMKQDKALQTVNDLWYYFYGNLNTMLKRKGLYLSAWEEMGLRKVLKNGKTTTIPNPDFANDNVHLDVWNNVIGWGAEDLAYQLANAGYKVVLSPVSNLYFDLASQKAFAEPGYYWGGYVDVDKPFYFIPFNYYRNATEDINGNKITQDYFKNKERLTPQGRQNIVGIQGLLWGETSPGAAQMEYKLLPKLLALAERSWAPSPAWADEADSLKAMKLYQQDWSRFVNVMGKRELPRL